MSRSDRRSLSSRIFRAAATTEPPRRADVLERMCGTDETLRCDVEAMLRRHDSLFGSGAGTPSPRPSSDSAPLPRRVGPFEILWRIGEGGMGVVYRARQIAPVRREVAVKVLRIGLASPEAVARFRAEPAVLARLHHPNVARVVDAGVTDEGLPYFAMDYVEGPPITRYADERGLDVRARLKLFLDVCAGVEHAHRNAVIHRDIKPSNVLVETSDGHPVPRIIDFGVAKVFDEDEVLHWTRAGALVGTPQYMSPEQADPAGGVVDTRSDVYSLGMLLYELLTGALPYDRTGETPLGIAELRRRLEQGDPTPPSRRVVQLRGETDRTGDVDCAAQAELLAGDLDWIVLKCLEHDPDRRYGSAADLAADLRRHLADLPVEARPHTGGYRAGKFLRRHRVAVAVSAVFVLLIAGSVAGLALMARENALQARRAAEQARRAEEVSQFLVDLLDTSSATVVRARFEGGADSIVKAGLQRTRSQPLDSVVAGRLRAALGESLARLGPPTAAIPILEDSVATLTAELGPDDPTVLDAVDGLGRVLRRDAKERTGRDYARALSVLEQNVDARLRRQGADDPATFRTMRELALTAKYAGHFKGAEAWFRQARDGLRRHLGADDDEVLVLDGLLAGALIDLERYEEASAILEPLAPIVRERFGERNPEALAALYNLAIARTRTGHPDAGLATLRDVVDLGWKQDPSLDDHLALLRGHPGFDEVVRDASMNHEVRRVGGTGFEQSLLAAIHNNAVFPFLDRWAEATARVSGAESDPAIQARYHAANWLVKRGRCSEAETQLDDMARTLGDSILAADVLWARMQCALRDGDRAEATNLIRRTIAIQTEALGPDNPVILYDRACLLSLQGDTAGAISTLREALSRDLAFTAGPALRDDRALDPLRSIPEFRALSRSARERYGSIYP